MARRTGLIGILLSVLLTLGPAGCGPLTFTIGSAPADKLTHTVVIPADGFRPDRVAIVDVSGLIVNASPRGLLTQGENPVSLLHEQLQEARRDSRVKAVVLRINSPGGTVTASDAMYRQVKRFREETGKPVVALMMDVAASGGYYLACSADDIVAYPTTVTGSIGVILQTITVKPALDRIGVRAEALTTGPNKDAGSPLSELTDEHRAVLNSMIDDFYQRFLDTVRTNRPNIPEDQFATVTDGRIVSGEKALTLGLVDHVGDLETAFAHAMAMAKIDRAELIRYHRPGTYIGSPYMTTPMQSDAGSHVQVNLLQLNLHDAYHLPGGSVGFLYLWQPASP